MAHEFWYGDAESHQVVLNAQASVRAMAQKISADGGELPTLPPVWNKDGDIAVVNVFGSLVTGTAGFWRLFGVTGYQDIRDAVIEAIADESVSKILLQVESPGGATNGVQELADIIAKLGAIKPIYGHSEQIAASAGYWILISAGTATANRTAQVGSIGCIATLSTYVRAYEEMGKDVKVVRSDEYKGLGNPNEPISALAEADLQSKVNDLADMFKAWVTKRREITADAMGQGRVFLGQRALSAGLIDKVANYDQVIRMIEKS